MDISGLQPWESLAKRIIWKQLGDIEGKKVLDYGSGYGVTADYLAEKNTVVAVEPSAERVSNRWRNNNYRQICGNVGCLETFSDESYDVIICHNVLEYTKDREEIFKHFSRILKKDGFISLVKHNRPGRVMQKVVLLNDFDEAYKLLDNGNSMAEDYGEIVYYDDSDIEKWCSGLKIYKKMGLRVFWDLQQNQDYHRNPDWQDRMIDMEMRVSEIKDFQNIAFFHHFIIKK